jgi:2-phospho-L-lactate guanylyltransferase
MTGPLATTGAGPTTAVVPLRDGRTGKSRLTGSFSADERTAIVASLARHVVGTLLTAGPVSRVLVVTGDPQFARRTLPADPRLEIAAQPPEQRGLNAAVALGRAQAAGDGARRVLVVHADLPLLTSDDVAAVLTPAAPLVLATDRAGVGTNALVLDAAEHGFRFRFGVGSARAHLDQAATLGLEAVVVRRPGTWTDLDTPEDWLALPASVRERLIPGTTARAAQPDQ